MNKTKSSRGSAKVTSGGHSNAARVKRRAIQVSQGISSSSELGSDSEPSEAAKALCQPIATAGVRIVQPYQLKII